MEKNDINIYIGQENGEKVQIQPPSNSLKKDELYTELNLVTQNFQGLKTNDLLDIYHGEE